jgi:hypothetical protein
MGKCNKSNKCNSCDSCCSKPCDPCESCECKFTSCTPPKCLYPKDCSKLCCKQSSCNDCKKKKCKKHHRCSNKCDCPKDKFAPCLKKGCCLISISLNVTTEPLIYTTVGQQIVYTFTITNTGNETICFPIQVVNDLLGRYDICYGSLAPNATVSTTAQHTITAADLLISGIETLSMAFVHYKCHKWIKSQAFANIVFNGGVSLSGSLVQVYDGISGLVTVTVTIFNSINSLSAALNVTLPLTVPSNVANIVPGANVTVGAGVVTASIASIPIGGSQVFTFTYQPVGVAGTSYTWTGAISTTSYVTTPGTNIVSGTLIPF